MKNATILFLSQEPLSLPISPSNTALCLTFIYLIYALTVALYNITLHPLARFPGPKLRGAFFAIEVWHIWLGDVHSETKRLHDIYGETVRVRPNALSFNNAQAWKDIYGHRPGKGIIPKAPEMYEIEKERPGNIIATSNDSDHSRIRRLLNPAFSENALQQQEAILNHYFELLISKLRDKIRNSTAAAKKVVNLSLWYNFTTFDIISDLCFGESFEMLEKEEYDSWIANIFKGVKVVELFRILRVYSIVGTPILYLLQTLPMVTKARRKHQHYSMDKVAKRLDSVTDRRDFLSYISQRNDEKGMSPEEIGTLSETLLIAGSETTATLLCGVTFYLLINPDSLQKLTDEVRNSFSSAADITLRSLTKLPYLQACLDEALRLYPPVASTLPRLVRPEGDVVNGQFIPGGTTVGVNSWSAGRSERNFKDSSKYIPERWLRDQDNRYIDDDRASIQPFSLGPRSCIGQNLAYAEMRAILARMVWNFDMELCEDSRNWTSQKVFILWEKLDLNVRLSERVV